MKKTIILFLSTLIVFSSIFFATPFAYGFYSQLTKQKEIALKIGEWKLGLPSSLLYMFKDYQPNDFLNTGKWDLSSEGFRSGFGLLYIENPYESYEISLVAQLGIEDQSQGIAGGFGLLFETTIDEDLFDTGYVLQFDRGYGGIIIRPRISGKEERPILTITYKENSYIPQSKRDPFWSEEKEITLRISKHESNDTIKTIDLWIDGVLIVSDFQFDVVSSTEPLYTGFRSWTTKTEYRSLELKERT